MHLCTVEGPQYFFLYLLINKYRQCIGRKEKDIHNRDECHHTEDPAPVDTVYLVYNFLYAFVPLPTSRLFHT